MNENQSGLRQQLSPDNAPSEQNVITDAIQYCREGLAIYPENFELWYNLGTSLIVLSRFSEAIDTLQQAIALKPDFANAYINWGVALNEQGLPENAIQCYRQGLAACPDNADLWYSLGSILLAVSRLPEAVTALQQAIALEPGLACAYTNLGNAFNKQSLSLDAIQCYQTGLANCPGSEELWFNLGTSLLKVQRLPEAVAALKQAITLKPDFADAYLNLGNALQAQGQAENAIAAYNQALALNPTDLEIYYNRATAILLSGNLEHGFYEYEWRTQIKRFHHFYEWFGGQPRWCGENFAGKRLLIYHEQGFGDALQFCRYLPLVKARGGSVLFSAKKPLLRLLTTLPGCDELIEHTAEAIRQAKYDLVVPLLSLPYIFGTTLSTIPANIPYLAAGQHSIAVWRNKINAAGPNLRVGLVWASNSDNIVGHIRTCGLQAMAPLAEIPGITFYSLQKDKAALEAHTPPPGMPLIDLTGDIDDFADTAALIMNLDLVISVDTAVTHLAGALGKPVWTLLPAAGEWRWLLKRNDSPWYPAIRLFRQSTPGDWRSVMTAVAQELRMLVSA